LDPKKSNSYIKGEKFTRYRVKQVIYFFIILAIGALFVWVISKMLSPAEWAWYWKLTLVYFVPPAGKETVIPAGLGAISSLGIGVPISPFIWGFSIWVFDLLACLAILTNWWLLELFISLIPTFPFIGIRWKQKPRVYKTKVSLKTWYDGLHRKTQVLEAKRYGKLLPFALFIFMFIPFQGTGAMSTTVIGTWLGFRFRETFLIVAMGSLLSIIFMILIVLGILRILN